MYQFRILLILLSIVGGIAGIKLLFVEEIQSSPAIEIVDNKLVLDRIYVSGAITNPGLYDVPLGSRVGEVVEISGGITINADLEYVNQQMNMAKRIQDGEHIYVRFRQENLATNNLVKNTGPSSANKININEASVGQLDELEGIGPSTANKIVSARPFEKIEDLLEVEGIGEKTFESIKDFVSV